MIDFDVETDGLQWPYHKAFMYQFGDDRVSEDASAVEVLDPEKDRRRIEHWFERARDEGIRAWNSKFDLHFAANDGFELPPESKWFDGMLSAHAIEENRSVALKPVANTVLGPGADDLQKQVKEALSAIRRDRKKEATENGTELVEPNYSDAPRDLMSEYAAEDIVLTRRVGDVYDPVIASTPDLKGIVDFEHEVMAALWHAERRGMPVDEQGYRKLLHEVALNVERLNDEVEVLASHGIDAELLAEDADDPWSFNVKSSAQIADALKRRGADLTWVTKSPSGNLSMDAENLSTVDDDLARKVLQFRSEFKAMSTYINPMLHRSYVPALRSWKEPFIASDGRIHANFRQVGAKTGRMSCSDPNLQNQPRDDLRLRYNFRAEPGYKLVAADLSSVEMAIFAAYAGEGALLSALKNGEDMHAMTAKFIGITDRKRSGGAVESARQRGKTFNFSMVYGGGIRTIRKQQRVSQDEARRMLQRYKDAYPEVVRLQNRIAWKIEEAGYIKSAWGRRFRVSQRDAFKAVNYLVQGTAADLLKASLIRLHKEGIPVVACVHDEIIAHVPEEDAEEAKIAIERAMVEHPRITDKVPLAAEGEIMDRWSESKDPTFKPEWAR